MANLNESCTESRGDFDYTNVEVDEELLCSICKLPYVLPVESEVCSHTFCQSCIHQWLTIDDICPICRADLVETNLVKVTSKIVVNQLDRLIVKCNVCGETNIASHREHLLKCPKKIIPCLLAVDLKCPWTGSRDEAQRHAETCLYQQLRPILDQYREEIETLKKQQMEQKRLQKLIVNNGYPMHANCVIPNCYYANPRVQNDPSTLTCTFCKSRLSCYVDMAQHSCYGGCICQSCSRKYDLVDETIKGPAGKRLRMTYPQPMAPPTL